MDIQQAIINKLSSATNALIVISGSSGDSLASGLALRAFLKKLDKDVTLFSLSEPSSRFDFLPEAKNLSRVLDLIKTFVVNVNTKRTELKELSYKKNPEQLSIFLKPAQGEFNPSDVSFGSSAFPYE